MNSMIWAKTSSGDTLSPSLCFWFLCSDPYPFWGANIIEGLVLWFPTMLPSISAGFCISVCWAAVLPSDIQSSLQRWVCFRRAQSSRGRSARISRGSVSKRQQEVLQWRGSAGAGLGWDTGRQVLPSALCAALITVLGTGHGCPLGRASI